MKRTHTNKKEFKRFLCFALVIAFLIGVFHSAAWAEGDTPTATESPAAADASSLAEDPLETETPVAADVSSPAEDPLETETPSSADASSPAEEPLETETPDAADASSPEEDLPETEDQTAAEASEISEVTYDVQPVTLAEVQAAIDAYEMAYRAALDAEGYAAALEVPKPRWQYNVQVELMPEGYNCQLVTDDTGFSADYYTFFVSPVTTANEPYYVDSGVSTTVLQNDIDNADAGDTFIFKSNYQLTATLKIDKDLNFTTDGGSYTITSPSGQGRHIDVTGAEVELAFSGVTLRGYGNVTGALSTSSIAAYGGISSKAEKLTVIGVTIENCRSNTYGAGIYAEGDLTLEGCIIRNNKNRSRIDTFDGVRAINGGAVAIYNPIPAVPLTLNIDNTQILENTTDDSGGGIYLASEDMTVNINKSHINKNTGGGGGLYAFYGGAKISIKDSEFLNNTSTHGGGGIYLVSVSNSLDLDNTKVIGNTAASGGGGIFINNGPYTNNNKHLYSGEITPTKVRIYNGSEVNGNTGVDGGGIKLQYLIYNAKEGAASELTIEDTSTVNGNTATGNGGGIYIYGKLTMQGSSTVSNNKMTSGKGGGVYVDGGTMTMSGGTISGNTVASYGGGVYIGDGHGLPGIFNMSGGTIGGSNTATHGGGVYVNGGTMTMSGGTISSNAVTSYGGGVYIGTGNGVIGKFDMSGGTIGGNNTATHGGGVFVSGDSATGSSSYTITGGTVSGNTATALGGGVYLGSYSSFTLNEDAGISKITGNKVTGSLGGGVYVSRNSTCVMSAGSIDSNTAKTNGGGVYLAEATADFQMGGGTINNNTATDSGGGVCINAGIFTMSGGTIGEKDKPNKAVFGGGVYMNGTSTVRSSYTMTGGAISSNTADTRGGGVYMYYSNFTMSGGTIDNNTATGNGGGAYIREGTFTMSAGTVSDNTTTTGNGGGVYVEPAKAATLTTGKADKECFFTGNKALSGDGGGIYTTQATGASGYSNLTVGEAALFADNVSQKYHLPPDANAVSTYSLWSTITNYQSSTSSGNSPVSRVEPVNNDDINTFSYTITFYSNGGSAVAAQTVGQYSRALEPNPNSTRQGYRLLGWYTENTLKNLYGFNTPVTRNLSLYAKWVEGTLNLLKVDAKDYQTPLAGVKFKLYICTDGGTGSHTHTAPDAAASCWEQVGSEQTSADGTGSAAKGMITFTGLGDGTYLLMETEALSGYELPRGQWIIEIGAETGKISAAGTLGSGDIPALKMPVYGQNADLVVGNIAKYKLPAAGGDGTFRFALLGGALLTGGLLILFYRRKSGKRSTS